MSEIFRLTKHSIFGPTLHCTTQFLGKFLLWNFLATQTVSLNHLSSEWFVIISLQNYL